MRLFLIIFIFGFWASAQGTPNPYVLFPAGCTPDPNEQHTAANAASDPNCNEADDTAGWTNAAGEGSFTSDATDPAVGGHALKKQTTGGSASYCFYSLSITSGDTFTVTYRIKSTQGSLARSTAWTNVTGETTRTATSTWTEYTENITASATGTAQIRFYASINTSGVNGDNIFVDDLSIIKTN